MLTVGGICGTTVGVAPSIRVFSKGILSIAGYLGRAVPDIPKIPGYFEADIVILGYFEASIPHLECPGVYDAAKPGMFDGHIYLEGALPCHTRHTRVFRELGYPAHHIPGYFGSRSPGIPDVPGCLKSSTPELRGGPGHSRHTRRTRVFLAGIPRIPVVTDLLVNPTRISGLLA